MQQNFDCIGEVLRPSTIWRYPEFSPTSPKKSYRKYMTIAAGFVCSNGIVYALIVRSPMPITNGQLISWLYPRASSEKGGS